MAIELLYHQHQIVAVNKPVGLLSQPTRDQANTVLTATYGLLASHGAAQRELYPVHRLDRDTSGVMLLATSKSRATYLAQELRAHRVAKTYLALCHGVCGLAAGSEFVETAPLGRYDPATGRVWIDHRDGRSALTRVRVLGVQSDLGVSLVACYPASGRTHQIRVHLAQHGLPLVGDAVYGGVLASHDPGHHLLHAAALAVTPSKGQPAVRLQAPLPTVFAAQVERCGLQSALAAWSAAPN